MHRPTIEVYEQGAAYYAAARPPRHGIHARRLAAEAAAAAPDAADGTTRSPIADLGCGPGGYLGDLGTAGLPVVAFDGAHAMLAFCGHRPAVRGDLELLPFRRHSLAGAWARNSYLHVPANRLPLAMASLHHALRPGAPVTLSLLEGDGEGVLPGDDLPGRCFTLWRVDALTDVLVGAGFAELSIERVEGPGDSQAAIWARAVRARTLPDFVGPGLRFLLCGLNPSLVAADAGFGFASPSNRFWRAATEAGLLSRPRDPWHALLHDRVGMTDFCKRATARSSELSAGEYRAGADRVRRLVERIRPGAVVVVGMEGWRAAIDRRAQPGWQRDGLAGVPAYVMPSTSGLNARVPLADLIAHLRNIQGPITGEPITAEKA